MIVDLHAHYPMHVTNGQAPSVQRQLRDWREERFRARLVHLISYLANYEGPGGEPGVTIELMHEGDVGVALSVLYVPSTEIDLDLPYGSPPKAGYIESLIDQMDRVEQSVVGREEVVCPVTTRAELESAVEPGPPGRLALIHCVEGGHVLGASEDEIRRNVARLAARGVAYVTIAHLLWRQVATNAPALPFLPDWIYRRLFHQPRREGLSSLGQAAVRAMCEKRVLIDLTHMSAASIHQTLDLLDEIDGSGEIPVIASHGACRFPVFPRSRVLHYNLTGESIRRIAQRGGVIGLIACKHYISRGLRPWHPTSFDDSVELLCAHIDRIRDVTHSLDHVAIGSDLDGFIKPALPGLTHMGRMDELQAALHSRYGPTDGAKICSLNALRVLRYRFQ